jgi:Kef-type K+ transport system membrane component KefB
MKRILTLTLMLLLGLLLSQIVPLAIDLPHWFDVLRNFLTMGLLAYIMIEVGREFEIDLSKKKELAIDYGVAATAAAFPWVFCTIYFLLFLMPEVHTSGRSDLIEASLAGRFASPTSAGVLFTMLAAAGLAGTWTFRKTRILAIFDDLDTVLFMIPLKMLIVGIAWQLGVVVFIMVVILLLGWRFFRKIDIPTKWPWVLTYALLIAAASETLYAFTKDPATMIGVHIEVLLPAFLLGCALKPHRNEHAVIPGEHPVKGIKAEEIAGFIVSCTFLLLVGFSMPTAFGDHPIIEIHMSIGELILHVLMITLISNLGKMFVCFCYRREVPFRQRLAVSVAMFPRGEVGAGVLAVSLGYGIQGPFVTVAFLSLALNLILTGVFIVVVKRLIDHQQDQPAEC